MGLDIINLEDSDDSLFVLQVMSSDFEVDLNDHASTFIKELPSKLPVGKIVKVDRGLANREIAGRAYDGVQIKFSISFLGSTAHTFECFFAKGGETNALVMIQAPDEDLKAAEKEFQVMFASLKLK